MKKLRSFVFTAAAMVSACLLTPLLPAQPRATACATLIQENQVTKAERCARGVLASDPRSALAYEIVGAARLRERDYATGKRMLGEAIRLEPGLVGARLDLADALALEGKYGEAAVVLREALRLMPNSFDAGFALVRVENAQGHYRQSLEQAERLQPQLSQREDGLTVLLSDELGLNDREAVASLLGDWLALDHPSPADSVVLAELLAAKNDETDAIQVLTSAEARDPSQFDIHYLLGELYVKTDVPERAREEYEAGVAIRSDCTHCLFELGRLADARHEFALAREMLVRAQAFNAQDVDVLTALGKVCLEMDLQDEAIRSLAAAAKLRPESDSTQYMLASAYTSKKDYVHALAILTRLAGRHPGEALFPYSIGSVLYLSGDYAAAETQLRRSLVLDAKNIGALYYLGLTLGKQERLAEAEDTFHRLLAEAPQHPAGLAELGKLLLTEGRYETAKTVLEQAVEHDPTSANAHYALGRTLARLGMHDASNQEFAIVESLNRRN